MGASSFDLYFDVVCACLPPWRCQMEAAEWASRRRPPAVLVDAWGCWRRGCWRKK